MHSHVLRAVAVIPARAKSRSIPHKNMKKVGGKPLLTRAIETAWRSNALYAVFVSTDSEHYMKIARKSDADIIVRPRELAEDVPTEDVVLHALNEMRSKHKLWPEVVVVIQCTSPFLKPKDIDTCVKNVVLGFDSCVTMRRVKEYPEWMFIQDGDEVKPVYPVSFKGDWGVRQCLPEYYIPTGACYAVKRDFLVEHKMLMGGKMGMVEMEGYRGLDIDDKTDLILAQTLAEEGEGLK